MHTGKLPPRPLETARIAIYDFKIRNALSFEAECRSKAALAGTYNQHIKNAFAAAVTGDRPSRPGKVRYVSSRRTRSESRGTLIVHLFIAREMPPRPMASSLP